MAKFSGIKSPSREGRDEARAMAAYEKELARKRERAELEAAAGSSIVNADFRKQFEKEKAGQLAFENTKKALAGQGQTEEQAMAGANEARVIAMATPAERFFMESRKRDQAQRAAERGKSIGQFEKDVNTSIGFGEQSNLLKPEGRQRAVKAGMKAGLSFAEADTAVQNAFGLLKEVGKRDKWKSFAPPEQYGPPKELANVAATPTATPAAPKPPTATQIAAAEMPTQTPEQNVKEAVSEAVGLNEEGRNPVLQAAQGGSLAANLMRQYSKGAINKEVDVIAAAGGRTRTSLGRESKSLLGEYNKAKTSVANMQRLATGATAGSPLSKGLATVTQKATEAGTKSTEGLKALQAAVERSGAQKAADLGRKVLGSRALKGVSRFGNVAQVAEPLLEAYKYNKNPELFDQKVEEILGRNEAGLLPTVGAAVRDVTPTPLQFFNPNYSPVGTMAATIVAPLEAQRRLSEAQGELAFQKGSAEIARQRADQLTQQRRSMVSDEDYAKMSAEQKRESSMKAAEALRQLREAARKRK